MRIVELDNRLSLCASFVRKGSLLVDVGTDHCYLPCYLIHKGIINKAIATDINPGPLNSGRECAIKYEMIDKIDFRLCNGLEKVNDNEAEDIVIAGMGAELIIDILNHCPFDKKDKYFILQPMTKYEVLIKYLYENGYEILEQKATSSDNKFYTVILAKYTEKKEEKESYKYYLGKLDLSLKTSKEFLSHILTHLKNQSIGAKSKLKIISSINKELENAED